ncbi:hypothetical protein SAMN04488544_1834 [Microlunatus sagamiharensis]|uniref:Camelysin metallo-endopeptidase n=1 Tax=Microlunatus sagamiharensis TaxID=546874 RepID=A0A1H2MCU4_9ACTN|nr:hypothetical protein [Microlunatus sagamiharensis]SDU91060.1 hypothetical protein SAMN04488544_1834 [Microlunatus sagamiharensis]
MSATTSRRPSRRLAATVSLVAAPAALALSGLVVAQSSYSAYSATTADPSSNWATGTVALTDDDANAAAFTATNLKPGSTGSRCIVVTSNGTLPSAVRMYGRNGTGTTMLGASMNLTVTQGTGGSFGSCDGFVPLSSGAEVFNGSFMDFGMNHTGFNSGVGSWNPTGARAESRTYKISYAISSGVGNDTQGGTAAGELVFEAQNS